MDSDAIKIITVQILFIVFRFHGYHLKVLSNIKLSSNYHSSGAIYMKMNTILVTLNPIRVAYYRLYF